MSKLLRINDPQLMLYALLATGLGLLLIFDAGYAKSISAGYGPIPREFKSQIVFLVFALMAAGFVSAMRPDRWQNAAKWLWGASLVAIALPFVPHLGASHNGAMRWIKLGPLEIQPAEFVKVSVIVFLAAVFSSRSVWPKRIKPARNLADALDRICVPKMARWMPALWAGLAVILIEKEPDMGTAFIVAVVAFVMMCLGGVSRNSLIAAVLIAVAGLGFLTWSEPYRMKRIVHFWDPWTVTMMDDVEYQTIQSKIAMAAGGVPGVGIGAGRAKMVMPEAGNDFVAATIGEEFGLVGMLVVLCVIGLLVRRLFILAKKAPNRFARLVLGGVGSWIGLQTILNVLMANATIPAIGVPLPFISAGGSSLIALWLGVGLSQSMLNPIPEPAAEKEKKVASRRYRWWNRRPRLSRA